MAKKKQPPTAPPSAGYTCNLDCIRKNPIKTFDGPVKIVLVDIPKREYCLRAWWAGFLGFAYMLIGFYVINVFTYCTAWKDTSFEINIHIFFCTAGFQLLMPAGILMNANLHGPSTPLKPGYRKINHIILQISAITLSTAGSCILLTTLEWPDMLKMKHCVFGVLAMVCMLMAGFLGPFGVGVIPVRFTHAFCGLLAYIFSSVCFILGLSIPNTRLVKWFQNQDLIDMMIIACLVANFLIVTYIVLKLLCCYERYCDNTC